MKSRWSNSCIRAQLFFQSYPGMAKSWPRITGLEMGLGVAVAITAIFILPDTDLIGDTVISIKTKIAWGLIGVPGSRVQSRWLYRVIERRITSASNTTGAGAASLPMSDFLLGRADGVVQGMERAVLDQRRIRRKLVRHREMRVTSRASSMVMRGRIPGMARTSRVLPAPGGPIIKMFGTKDRCI